MRSRSSLSQNCFIDIEDRRHSTRTPFSQPQILPDVVHNSPNRFAKKTPSINTIQTVNCNHEVLCATSALDFCEAEGEAAADPVPVPVCCAPPPVVLAPVAPDVPLEGAVVADAPPNTADNVVSLLNCADTPLAFVHDDGMLPVPATKLTAAH